MQVADLGDGLGGLPSPILCKKKPQKEEKLAGQAK